jgi:hypothetical protein
MFVRHRRKPLHKDGDIAYLKVWRTVMDKAGDEQLCDKPPSRISRLANPRCLDVS